MAPVNLFFREDRQDARLPRQPGRLSSIHLLRCVCLDFEKLRECDWQREGNEAEAARVSGEGQGAIPVRERAVMLRLCAMFFMMGMGPGMWIPGLTNIIIATGWGHEWVTLAFLIIPVASMLSPLLSGALADQKVAAQKLAGWISILGTLGLSAAFYVLRADVSPWWFVGLFFVTSVVSAPLWNLVITVAMTHLPEPERQFPQVRLWCTLGWILGGWVASLVLRADASPLAGYAGAVCRLVLAGLLFLSPDTPPRGVATSWRSLCGFDAFRLLRARDVRVLLIATALLSMPLVSFYMHVPDHLRELGDARPTFTMSFGQWSEVAAMVVTGWLMMRYPLKRLLLVGFGCCVLRFVIFAIAGQEQSQWWMGAGISIHGICYTLFFVTGQIFLDRRVEPGMRGQMQGLLGWMTNGIGSLLGTLGLHWLHQGTVERSGDWGLYWWVLAGFTLLCMGWFARAFHEKAPSS
jgi:MFS family permease